MSAESVPSPWGDLVRSSTTLESGEVIRHDWFLAETRPEIVLRTGDPAAAAAMIGRAQAILGALERLSIQAAHAVVTEFSDDVPTPGDLDEAVGDLVVTSIEVHPEGTVVLHLDDTCAEHFLGGYWPAVHLDAADRVTAVTVES